MRSYVVLLLVGFFASTFGLPWDVDGRDARSFELVTRAGWGGRAPTSVTRLNTPVQNVIIHHTVSPGACSTRAACSQAMRTMQNVHQQTNGWADIGYNFAVGGDGAVYEGRGWTTVGAHASGFNSNSIGIAVIGNWSNVLPTQRVLQVVRDLIAAGVRAGHIRAAYTLLGHRQVGATECPGNSLFREISTWRSLKTVDIIPAEDEMNDANV